MTNETLATYANYALWSGIAVLTLAMLAHLLYLAGAVPAREGAAPAGKGVAPAREDTEAREGARTPVAVGGAAAAEAPAGTDADVRVGADADVPAAPDGSGSGEGAVTPVRAAKSAGIAASLSWLGTLLLAVSIACRGLSVGRPPVGNLFEFSVVWAFFAMAVWCVWSLRRDLRWLGLFVTGPVVLLLGVASTVWYTEAAELVPSLKSYWLGIHVTVATLSVGLFIVGAILSALYLASDRAQSGRGEGEQVGRFWSVLPPARSLERLSYTLHIIAFPLWTFTLIAGAIWARQAWGAYWNWDPKEVWTFVIWVVYAAYLHARATKNTSRRITNWIALAGFACIVINYTVVNFYFIGQHSYAGTS